MGLYDSIVITGGGGMLAHAFKRALTERGLRFNAVPRKEWDITDPPQIGAMFEDYRPSLVLNCAAYTKVDLCERETDQCEAVNGRAVGTLAQVCRDNGATLVHFSTDYVFDGTIRRPLRPDDPVGPQSAYGQSKLMGERLLQANAPARWLILRTAWLYGPNGPNFVQTMVNAARAGKPLRVVNDQVGSPTYTLDLAAAALDLLDRGASGIWHVTNAGETTWFDLAKAIFEEWGLAPELSSTTSAQWKQTRPDSAIRPAYSVLDVGPVEKLLGRQMRGWREALRAFKTDVDSGGF
jgi:dTDP-4-dehydrorhamnose reductase